MEFTVNISFLSALEKYFATLFFIVSTKKSTVIQIGNALFLSSCFQEIAFVFIV